MRYAVIYYDDKLIVEEERFDDYLAACISILEWDAASESHTSKLEIQ
jgi:hypothetical protein